MYGCVRARARVCVCACGRCALDLLEQLGLTAFIRPHQRVKETRQSQFALVVLGVNRSQLAQHKLCKERRSARTVQREAQQPAELACLLSGAARERER